MKVSPPYLLRIDMFLFVILLLPAILFTQMFVVIAFTHDNLRYRQRFRRGPDGNTKVGGRQLSTAVIPTIAGTSVRAWMVKFRVLLTAGNFAFV